MRTKAVLFVCAPLLAGCLDVQRTAQVAIPATQPIDLPVRKHAPAGDILVAPDQDVAGVIAKVDKLIAQARLTISKQIEYDSDVWLLRLVVLGSIAVNLLLVILAYRLAVRRARTLAEQHGYWAQRAERLLREKKYQSDKLGKPLEKIRGRT